MTTRVAHNVLLSSRRVLCFELVESIVACMYHAGTKILKIIMNFEFTPLSRLLNVGRLFFGQFLTSGSLITLESVI